MEDCKNDGYTNHEGNPARRCECRNCRCRYIIHYGASGYSGEHNPYYYRRYHWGRRNKEVVGREMGCNNKPVVGVDPYDSCECTACRTGVLSGKTYLLTL